MIGEWSGNVRSTPTPKDSLRTVKDSRTPLPRRAMTAPSNPWTRSRVPPTPRTWTFTVSPGAKSGTSSRRLAWSTRSVGCIVYVLLGAGGTRGRSGKAVKRSERVGQRELLEQRPLVGAHPAPGLDEVRPALDGPGHRRGPPHAGHAPVVARAQHLGDLPAPEAPRPGVVRVLEQPA